MKTLALFPALLLAAACQQAPAPAASPAPTAAPAAAPAPAPAPATEDPALVRQAQLDLCKGYADLARSIMDNRQQGVAMDRAMDIAKDNAPVQEIVIAAYDEPRMLTAESQQRYVQDFGNETYLACVKGLRAG